MFRRPTHSQGVPAAMAAALLDGLALALATCVYASVRADDWPTYQHDSARSGVTREQLAPPLFEQWVFSSGHPPQPAWPEPTKEHPRVDFDYAYHVAVSGDAVFFGSSADNKVTCLDAVSGQVLWSAYTDGPVRLAPTISRNRVFVGSDDGHVYCLNASDGGVVWKFRAAPGDEKLLGHGKMISLWPVRTGVLVDAEIAYFGAGIFPAEGVYLYAVRAEDGKLLWKNDSCGTPDAGGLSPQGYLLASAERLFVPTARTIPAAFLRKDGQLLHRRWHGWRKHGPVGGTYALLSGDHLYSGAGQLSTYDQETGAIGSAWFPGNRLILSRDTAYLLTDSAILALDRKTYPAAGKKVLESKAEWLDLDVNWRRMQVGRRMLLSRWLKAKREKLRAGEQRIAELTRAGKEESKEFVALQKTQEALTAEVGVLTDELTGVSKRMAGIDEEFKRRGRDEQKERQDAKELIRPTTQWRCPSKTPYAMILAGSPEDGAGVLFAGGDGTVTAVDAGSGREVWSGQVSGRARGLAVAGGRLFVSSDDGTIHCFSRRVTAAAAQVKPPVDPAPYPRDKLTRFYETTADRIVAETEIKRGYCLVLGCGTGRLAFELAKRTDLMIYGIEPDAKKAAAARSMLDAAGLYGVRVCVEQGALARIAYSDYFANLIVCEETLISGELPTPAEEVLRMLRPLGGVAYVGQVREKPGGGTALSPERLHAWLDDPALARAQVEVRSAWARITRGAVEGAGSWSHQYAEPGNTACADDHAVKCPIGPLWFGRPGPDAMCERHLSAASPVSANGRLFVQGDHVVMAYDAYNGLKLWERVIAGARRVAAHWSCGNLVATSDSLFLALHDTCLRLDAATGRTRQTYRLPSPPDGKPRTWGYIASANGLLFGSARKGRRSDSLFAFDIDSGDLRWAYQGQEISDVTIAIGGGRVFFAEGAVTDPQRKQALEAKQDQLKGLTAEEADKARQKLKRADVRRVVALDVLSGSKCWEKPVDLTDCGGGLLATIYRNNMLLFCGSYHNSHFYASMIKGELAHRRITALSALDGTTLWSRPGAYHRRPVVVGDTIYAEPRAYNIHTGEQKTRAHPLTGEVVPWEFVRGGGCGMISACPACFFFRSGATGYYDLVGDHGTLHFGGLKPGCWINMIPANGVVLAPEASAGCACLYPLRCTVAFAPRETNRAWGVFTCPGAATPVKHIAINLGAPGDRRDSEGTLWLGFPRPEKRAFRRPLEVVLRNAFLPECGYFERTYAPLEVGDTTKPWLFTSGCEGLRTSILRLSRKGEPGGVYTVRLYFAEFVNTRAGQRVFDLRLNGKPVLADFDIFKEAGAPNRAVVKEFAGIEVRSGRLVIELVSKVAGSAKREVPILNGIEAIRTQTLAAVDARIPAAFADKARRDFAQPPKYVGILAFEPAYPSFLFSRISLADWLEAVSGSSLVKEHGLEVRPITSLDDMFRACRVDTRDFLMIINPHGEDFPAKSGSEWRHTIDAVQHYVEHGGIWWETAGYSFWRAFFPKTERGKIIGWETAPVGAAGLDWLFGLQCKTLPWKSPPSPLRATAAGRGWCGPEFVAGLLGKEEIVTRAPPKEDWDIALVQSDNGPYIVGYQLSGWGWFFRIGGWGNKDAVMPAALRSAEYLYTHPASIHAGD